MGGPYQVIRPYVTLVVLSSINFLYVSQKSSDEADGGPYNCFLHVRKNLVKCFRRLFGTIGIDVITIGIVLTQVFATKFLLALVGLGVLIFPRSTFS